MVQQATPRPPFSICMATYNGEAFVSDQLRSIFQEMGPRDELIVIDDYSLDSTVTLVQQAFEAADLTHLTLVPLPYNYGHPAAFAKGISLATNPLIALADQDDLWPRGRLESLHRSLDASMADLVFASLATFGDAPRCRMLNPHTRLRGWQGLFRLILSKAPRYAPLYALGSACAFRKSACDPSIPIKTETHEDWLISQALVRGGVQFSPDIVTCRRIHPKNMTARRALNTRLAALIRTSANMAISLIRAQRHQR